MGAQLKRPRKTARRSLKVSWRRLTVFVGLVGAGITLVCVVIGGVAITSAKNASNNPGWSASLLTDTPTLVPVPSLTENSPEPSDTVTVIETQFRTLFPTTTPTITLTPTQTLISSPTSTPTPLPTPDGHERVLYVPILMYHYVSEPPPEADTYRLDLSVTPEIFREQMTWLKENDYETITLYHLLYALNIGWPPLPENPVILTFDDGYLDNYENAFPILLEYGFVGTFFILSDVTNRSQPGYMTWDMLREMHGAGMDIEVHGREHLDMSGQDREWLLYHLLGPVEDIAANLGYSPRLLAYPSGKYDDMTVTVAREVGLWGAVTTVHGAQQRQDAPFALRRLRIYGDMSLATFAAMLSSY